MRKVVLIVSAAAAAALPAIALADTSAHSSAEKQCRSERNSMGSATFKAAFGKGKNKSNAFGQCVSHRTQQNTSDQGQSQNSAEKQCRAERDTIGADAFKAKYGTNHNGENAFGKCVSSKARSMTESKENEQVKDEDSAAKQCRSERSSNSSTFKGKFGSKPDAFGKCVSQTAHQLEQHGS